MKVPTVPSRLTDRAVLNAKPKSGRYKISDDYGLYLLVMPQGGKHWRFDYRFAGARRTLSIGPYPLFSLAEARLGVLPATIGPHVLRAIGARASSRYMLTAEAFDGLEAVRLGLAHEAVDAPGLDAAVDRIVDALLAGGPQAQSGVKRLIREPAGRPPDDSPLNDTG